MKNPFLELIHFWLLVIQQWFMGPSFRKPMRRKPLRDDAAIARIYGTPNPPIPEGWKEEEGTEQPRESKAGEYYLATPRELKLLRALASLGTKKADLL